MNVTRCINNHYYDADKYSECPHCGAKSEKDQAEPENNKKSLFFPKKKKAESDSEMHSMTNNVNGRTIGIFDEDNSNKQDRTIGPILIDDSKENRRETDKDRKTNPVEPKPTKGIPAPHNELSLENNKKLIPNDSGKTVGFFSTGIVDNQNEGISEPVVGWLVCIKGNHFGESFNIVAGRNSVGRSGENKIVFSRDNTVSREKHAWITYEPKKREFFVQPGESSGLSYLNGDNIMESKKLSSHDELEFGDGKFIFIPLCGENFTWEDYITKE